MDTNPIYCLFQLLMDPLRPTAFPPPTLLFLYFQTKASLPLLIVCTTAPQFQLLHPHGSHEGRTVGFGNHSFDLLGRRRRIHHVGERKHDGDRDRLLRSMPGRGARLLGLRSLRFHHLRNPFLDRTTLLSGLGTMPELCT